MSQIQNSFLGGVPASGPQALFTKIELIPPAATVVDLKLKFDTGLFMGCQSVYIDALDSAGDIEMLTSFGQRITARKGTQGYYPILEGTDMRFTFKTSATSQDAVTVFFLNQPIAVGVWGETLLPATAETLGLVMIGSGITVAADGTISVATQEIPIASDSVLGGVKIGAGLSIDEQGVLSVSGGGSGGGYELPIASPTTLGGVKIGSGLSIDEQGVLSASGGGGGGGLQHYALAYFNRAANNISSSGLENAVVDVTQDIKTITFDLPAGLWLVNVELEANNPAATSARTGFIYLDAIEEGTTYQEQSIFVTIPAKRQYGNASAIKYFNAPATSRTVLSFPLNTTLAASMVTFYKIG